MRRLADQVLGCQKRLTVVAVFCAAAMALPSHWLGAQFQGFSGAVNSSDLYNNLPAWQGNNWFNNNVAPAQDWKLGVQAADLDIGVLIQQIAPNSAAARANLEVNDLIVAVGGQQVGIVDGRFVDLSTEIRRRANTGGDVALLVQDGRSGRLTSIRVQLDGNSQTGLRGVIVRRDRAALPTDAVVSVKLQNASRTFYVVRNGEVSFPAVAQNNIPFTINYDPSYIDPNDQYEVQAQITSGNRVIYRSAPVRVLGNVPSDNLQIEVTPTQTVAAYQSSSPVVAASYGYGTGGLNDAYATQYTQIYRRYLGRDPSPIEVAGVISSPNPQYIIESLPLNLMASQQYYDAVGNNNTLWITAVFQQIVGRAPGTDELNRWLEYFNNARGSRMLVLQQLAQSQKTSR